LVRLSVTPRGQLIVAMYYLRPYLIRDRDERERRELAKNIRAERDEQKEDR
jgi:hypothetical protein